MKTLKSIFFCLLISLLFCNVCFAATAESDTASTDVADKIIWTDAEKKFIEDHPLIRLGVDPEFIPYEFIDSDGVYKGMAADYIELICQQTGLEMVVEKDLTWSEAYEYAVEKKLDVLSCVSKTTQRQQYFLFSNDYINFQRVIFVNDSNRSINSIEDLYGSTAAVQTNSSHHNYLQAYKEIKLSLYPTVEEALQAVADGTETAFVGNLATSGYLIKSLGITNLKYMTIDTEEPQALYFAVREDWPELVNIINKALDNIGEEEKIAINNKWIGIETSTDYSQIIRIAGIVGIVIAIILTVSVFWIFRLRKEVAKRKKAQEQLNIAKEEAERANQIKTLFLARMSHEIRTPLNAIMGMSYLIKKTSVTASQSNYLDKLTQAARNMLGIINDILDFSKIEAGKIDIERISFELDKVLQRVINIASVKVEEQGIEFVMEKEPDMPSMFFGDPARIEQILTNLISNAVKFTEKGSVSLSVHVVSRSENTFHVEFCIKDTGIGIPSEQIEQLFIPFDQGDASINRRFGGTGLGLSIVKNLTDLMGGEIEVKSALNEGSQFYIRLPLEVDLGAEQKDAKRMAADCFKNVRALVLDKDDNDRIFLTSCFHSFGITADLVSHEDEAMHLLRKAEEAGNPYNLLILDFMTPSEGGIELFSRIKKSSLFKKLPNCILMVPMTRDDLFDEFETVGIDFAVTKPIIPSVLYNGIIEILEIKPPTALQTEKKQYAQTAAYPYHILLVEDNKTNQFIAQTILEQAGFKVSKADNGQIGYQFFIDNRKDIDLILMDIHMPVMDGYTASDLIRQIDADVPIAAMTADAIAGVEEKCKKHGIYHYVSKPFEPDQFVETILAILGNQNKTTTEAPDQKKIVNDTAPVLDVTDGIKRIGGDAGLYRMILQAFYNENISVAQTLKEKIDTRDFEQAIQIVHKIKSSSGNIGAKSLNEAASNLQKSLQSGDDVDILKRTEMFQGLFAMLIMEIKNYLLE
jgi:signal transduction histidine kinase/CheY-like chemotaxis protein